MYNARFAMIAGLLSVILRAASADTTTILFINNSLTYFNDMPSMIDSLGEHATPPIPIRTSMHSIPNSELTWHLTSDCFDLIRTGNFDYVVLQGYQDPIYDPASFYSGAVQLDDSIKAAGSQTVFFMTWAAPVEARDSFDLLAARYDSIGFALGALVVPVGRAWEELLTELPEAQLYWDAVHPLGTGSYIAACMFYAVITGESPVGNPYDPIVTPYPGVWSWACDSSGAALQRLAWKHAEGYNATTEAIIGGVDMSDHAPRSLPPWQPAVATGRAHVLPPLRSAFDIQGRVARSGRAGKDPAVCRIILLPVW